MQIWMAPYVLQSLKRSLPTEGAHQTSLQARTAASSMFISKVQILNIAPSTSNQLALSTYGGSPKMPPRKVGRPNSCHSATEELQPNTMTTINVLNITLC
jgi:hypothetical protein